MKVTLTVEVLLNSFILALIASLIRVLFTKVSSFRDTIVTFAGGIIFGVLAGYLANDIKALDGWTKIIIVVFSLFGKELFDYLKGIAQDPLAFFKKVKTEIPILNQPKNDT